jgi:predicted MFS family arabinose efflux permease
MVDSIAKRTGPPWPLVLACGSLVITLSMGIRQISGLFLRPVAVDLGLTNEAFGTAVAIQNLVWGLSQPFAGLLADRYGARPVVLCCGLLYLAGIGLAAMAPGGLVFMLGLGLLAGLGQSGTAHAVVLAVIGRAAPGQSRSVALGMASTAGSLGMFVLVPLTSLMLDMLDWRQTMLAMGGLLCLVPIAALALGEPRQAAVDGMPTSARAALASAGLDRDYWLLNIGFATCGFQLAFFATYLPTILVDGGLPASTGAAVLAAIGLFNIIGTYLAGAAGGRWPKSRVLILVYLGRAAAICAFAALPMSLATALAFGAVMGLLWTGTIPLTSGLVADLWGRRNLAFLFGVVYVGHQFGAFAGAWAGGYVYDRTGSFDVVWAATAVVSLSAAFCHFVLRERPRPVALAEAD